MGKIKPIDLTDEHGESIGIHSMSITYTQNPDADSPRGDDQYITIEAVPTIINEEDWDESHEEGYYYRINTDKWSVDSSEDLALLLDDFRSRLLRESETEQKAEDL
jgi:hypothetical protein